MSFLHWICETYLAKKQKKKGKRKSVNQYWQDFKMLYHQVNDISVDANNSNEIIKICNPSSMLFLYRTLILHMKYINSTLKDKFDLNTIFKPKPVAGSDNLLLLLIQHWAWDAHVFPTEDNQHDLVMLLLFQSYTGGQLAEFIHSSKGKASKDPLGKAEENKNKQLSKKQDKYNNNSHNITDGLEYNNDSNISDDSEYNNNLSDSDNNITTTDDDDLFKKGTDKGTDEGTNCNNSYSSDRINVTITENTHDC